MTSGVYHLLEISSQSAIENFQQDSMLAPDGHPDKPHCLSNLDNGYCARFERLSDLADLKSAITSFQQAFALTPDGNPDKAL